MKAKQATFLALLLSAPAPAIAACSFIDEGLREKQRTFDAFQAESAALATTLHASQARCRSDGAALTASVAASAAALSCTAESDQSHLDASVGALGESCESTFSRLKASVRILREGFTPEEDDTRRSHAFALRSELLKENCAPELDATKKLLAAMELFHAQVLLLERDSEESRASYGRFKSTVLGLASTAKARNAGCGKVAEGFKAATASPSEVPAGISHNGESTITGRIGEKPLTAEEKALLRSVEGPMPATPPAPRGGARASAGAENASAASRWIAGAAAAAERRISALDAANAASAEASAGNRAWSTIGSLSAPIPSASNGSSGAATSVGSALWSSPAGAGDHLELAVNASEATPTDAETSLFDHVRLRYRSLELRLNPASAATQVAQGGRW